MVETMAGGVAVFDYDGDGLPDIYFTNGASIPSLRKENPGQWNRLFHNDGGLKFTDVTERAGVQAEGYTTGAAAGDFDNDGRVDLFVAGVQRNQLFRNIGDGRFEDVTAKAGHRRTTRGRSPRDGSTTTTTAGSICSSSTTWTGRPRATSSAATARATCASTAIPGSTRACRTRSTATGTTAPSRTSRRSPEIAKHVGKGMSVAFADYDGDGFTRRVRDERRDSGLPVPQPRQRHVRGGGPARRRGGAGARPADFEHGRGLSGTTTTTAGPIST